MATLAVVVEDVVRAMVGDSSNMLRVMLVNVAMVAAHLMRRMVKMV